MSKKDEAFVLFDQGFETGSPEVKALGIGKNTRKNYRLLWKREREKSPGEDIVEEIIETIKPEPQPSPTLVSIHSIPLGAYFEHAGKLYRKTKYIQDKVVGWCGPEVYHDKAFNLTDMVIPK